MAGPSKKFTNSTNTNSSKPKTKSGVKSKSIKIQGKKKEKQNSNSNKNKYTSQAPIKKRETISPSKTGSILAFVAGILLLLAAGSIYNYFRNSQKIGKIGEGDNAQIAPVEKSENNIDSTKNDSEGITPLNESAQTTQEKKNDTTLSNNDSRVSTAWKANDYKYGDITGDQYTVKRGDTLWEISEALFGSGSHWQKIADANNVGYLSNGNPLIVPGQTLTIPAI